MKLLEVLETYPNTSRPDPSRYIPFQGDGVNLGWVKPNFAQNLLEQQDILSLQEDALILREDLDTPEKRTRAMAKLLDKKRSLFPGWRNELYPVVEEYGQAPYFLIERAGAMHLAFLSFAVNLLGYVQTKKGLAFWVGRRAMTKHLAPGKLDIMAGGGLPHDLSPLENCIKEAQEEAGIPRNLAEKAIPMGQISFALESESYLRREIQFNFALELPADFRPQPIDAEVEEFILLEQEVLFERISTGDDFLIDTVYVFLDFMVQRNLIQGRESELKKLFQLLHQPVDLQTA